MKKTILIAMLLVLLAVPAVADGPDDTEDDSWWGIIITGGKCLTELCDDLFGGNNGFYDLYWWLRK